VTESKKNASDQDATDSYYYLPLYGTHKSN